MEGQQGDAPVREGEIIAGKYEVLRVVAKGGMGVVVAARHIELGHSVALKFLLRAALFGPDAILRFQREARAIVQMKSAHVIRVSDVGSLPTGEHYLVMELLDGTDLKDLVEKDGPITIPQAADYIIQALDALAEAHSVGIVHRDIKPANLFMTKRADGTPLIKVLDFGIAKVTDPLKLQEASPTATGSMMGSPHYMAPEQILSAKDVDARCDVWALGVVLFEIVTGKLPFDGESFGVLFNQIMNLAPTPLSSLLPDAPPAFEALIARCLEKDVGNRIANVAELAQLLLPFSPSSASEVARIERLLGVNRPNVRTSTPPIATSPSPALPSSAPPITAPMPEAPQAGAVSAGPRVIVHVTPPSTARSPQANTAAPPPLPLPLPPPNIVPPITGSAWGLGKTSDGGAAVPGAPDPTQKQAAHRLPIFLGAGLVILILLGAFGLYKNKKDSGLDASSAAPPITATIDAAPLTSSTSPSASAVITTAEVVDASAPIIAQQKPNTLPPPPNHSGSSSSSGSLLPMNGRPTTSSSAANPIDMKLQ